MTKNPILTAFEQAAPQRDLQESLSQFSKLHIQNLVGSALSFSLADAFEHSENPFLLIANDKEEAAYYLNDLEKLVGEKNVMFYPASYRRPYQSSIEEETDNSNVLLRAEVLNRINSRRKPAFIVSYPDALFEKVVTRKELNKNTLSIKTGDELSIEFINEVLFEYNFQRVDFVTEPGDFALRGGIIDVFSFSNDQPFRIEFFGDDVDSIRTFDIEDQLSTGKVKKVSIVPNLEKKDMLEVRKSFLDYLSKNTRVFLQNLDLLTAQLDTLFEKAEKVFSSLEESVHQEPKELFCRGNQVKKELLDYTVAEIGNQAFFETEKSIAFATRPQPSFNKQFDLLIKNLNENHDKGYTNYIFCSSEQQAQRFHDIFEDQDQTVHYKTEVLPIYRGFIDDGEKNVCYTDHQIFQRYHKFRLKNGYAKKQAITTQELTNLSIGDYVTHIDHGIGKFGGLQKIDVEGKPQEAIKLIYGERDVLYLSIHSLHKISKYNGKDGKEPKLYKLGSNAWKKLKKKTKKKVKKVAYDLIKLYAKRRLKKGFQYGPDSYLQHELEASFLFEDTPDQSTATEAVKEDMESQRPMDRLICGDVGFGKTEVAIRAAFKAVDNGKQVAILVPTTILAFQHNQTFRERLKELPVTVDYLNRFRTGKERKRVLEELEKGTLDIVIGTHQLVNKSINFKNLGLLIVDEEQKFGVSVKDKLKTIKENVDTLTLTATPIPRTLQFSLMAARDLSTITTPPPNRYPIESRVVRFSEETIRDGVSYEIQRGGQVFFINNRIENIHEVAGLIQRLVPDAKVGVGHGQMEGKKLEKLMLQFIAGEFDVLVSTTIVESGLDVTNANTIFINDANNFGLSDLHQMRGRVGRSNKKAFCYFITPPVSVMTEEARKRIGALEQFTALGSGFNIAMKDLEIRGAGDILGGEQSGFINDIGFDTYQKILREAIDELKDNEFKELYENKDKKEEKNYVTEPQIDTDFQLQFPDDYINSIPERLKLYTRLNDLSNEKELVEFEEQLKDRFGELPAQAVDLLNSVRIKWLAIAIGLEKIIMKRGALIGYFVSDQQSPYYQTQTFSRVLQFVQRHPQSCTMKEKKTRNGLRLLLRFDNINSVDEALGALQPLEGKREKVGEES